MSGKHSSNGARFPVNVQAWIPEHDELWDCVVDAVSRSRVPRKVIAGALGYSEGQLSAILSGRENRQFPLRKLQALLEVLDREASGQVLNWIVWNFLATNGDRREHLNLQAKNLVPELQRLVGLISKLGDG